jgi:hypothetical protein
MLIVHIADITMFYAPASGGVRTILMPNIAVSTPSTAYATAC